MTDVKTQRDMNIEFRDEINKLRERIFALEARQVHLPPMQYTNAPTWIPATFTPQSNITCGEQ